MRRFLGRSGPAGASAGTDGRVDPWAGFAPGEDHEHHDPVQARFDTWRGFFWVNVQIGVWWVPVVVALGLGVLVACLVLQWTVPALVVGLAVLVFAVGSDLATPDWAKDHNERVAAAIRLERALAAQAEEDDRRWRVPTPTDAT
ncbi:MAG: hypothetical protein U0869_15055 [Chloroflexota bacterium]